MRAGIGQAVCRSSSSKPAPSASTMCGRGADRPSPALHRLDAPLTVAEHAEADVHPPAGERERPRVSGREVGLEPHVQLLGGGAGDVRGVLPEAVPLTEVAGFAGAERLADRAPHAVGGDHESRGDARARRRRRPPGRHVARSTGSRDRRGRRRPASRASRTSASSSCRRGVTAAYLPSIGSGTTTSRPDGERSAARSTSNQSGISPGRARDRSSSRRASVVRPSPQHLSRGNTALSITTTDRPARVSRIAADVPAGPAPTTTTSA